MHVGRNDTLVHRQGRRPAQAHVLADRGDVVGELLFEAVAAGIGGGQDGAGIAAGLQRGLGGAGHIRLEGLVAGHEVGLGIDLDHRAAGRIGDHADQAFGGHPARLLGGRGKALGAQPVDGLFHLAAGFAQRLLAVHHACAGLVAQFLHHRSRDRRHPLLPLSIHAAGRPADVEIIGRRTRNALRSYTGTAAPAPPSNVFNAVRPASGGFGGLFLRFAGLFAAAVGCRRQLLGAASGRLPGASPPRAQAPRPRPLLGRRFGSFSRGGRGRLRQGPLRSAPGFRPRPRPTPPVPAAGRPGPRWTPGRNRW